MSDAKALLVLVDELASALDHMAQVCGAIQGWNKRGYTPRVKTLQTDYTKQAQALRETRVLIENTRADGEVMKLLAAQLEAIESKMAQADYPVRVVRRLLREAAKQRGGI